MTITVGSSVGEFDSADAFQAILKAAIDIAVVNAPSTDMEMWCF
jgi:hypothetical protein